VVKLNKTDARFVESCLDPDRRESLIRSQRRVHAIFAATIVGLAAIWLWSLWPYFSGTGARSHDRDILFLLFLVPLACASFAARANVRLLAIVGALDERIRGREAEGG
jgi:hypothetical protein